MMPTRTNADHCRALNVPQRVQVELDNGRPGKVIRPPVRKPRRVESVIECWRVDDEWWRNPIARTYYEVVLETGGRVVLFQDLVTNEWWIQNT